MDYLATELRRWKVQQKENELTFGDTYMKIYHNSENKIIFQSKGLATAVQNSTSVNAICTYSKGNIIRKTFTVKSFKNRRNKRASFHHTYATTLIENGVTSKAVANRLGYANTVITQNIYTHNTRKMQEDAAAVFEKTLQTKP